MNNATASKLMKAVRLLIAGVMVVSVFHFQGVATTPVSAAGEPYRDTSLTFEERAADLVSRMTPDEKASQLNTSAAALSRLGVPAYNWWNEALHGVAWQTAVSFPSSLSMSLSWDRNLLLDSSSIIGDECRAFFTTNGRALGQFCPTVNMQRDPRWGRNEEGYGEDPFLVGELGSQYVIGMQGNNDTVNVTSPAGEKYLKVIATPKHYAANNSETDRYYGDSVMDNRTLREYYTSQFRTIAEKAHPASLMTAYNSVNGVPMFANTYLNNTMMRKTWGFDGYVVSDCDGVANIVNNHHWIPADPPGVYTQQLTVPQAVAFSLMGGTDLACNWTSGTTTGGVYTSNIQTAISQGVLTDNGVISWDDVDRSLVRMFTERMKTGEFDSTTGRNVGGAYGTYTVANHVQTASNVAKSLQASREDIVLLKNDGILPINLNTAKTIAVIGKFNNVCELGDPNYAGSPSTQVSFQQGLTTALNSKGFDTANNLKFYSPGAGNTISGYIFNVRDLRINGTTYTGADASSVTNCQKTSSNTIEYITDGSYANFNSINLSGQQLTSFQVSVATNGTGASWQPVVELHVDSPTGPLLATATCAKTSAWQTYTVNTGTIIGSGLINTDYTSLCLVFTTTQSSPPTDLTAAQLDEIGKADMAIYLAGTGKSGLLNVASENKDRANMDFPANQDTEIQQVIAKNPNTVVAIQAVGMMNIGHFVDSARALLFTSFNGQFQGQAMAETLLGDVNPTGRLSFSWYKNEADLPAMTDYGIRPTDTTKGRTYQYFTGDVLYPFGYGLSYSSYAYSNPTISKTTVSTNEKLSVSVDVENLSDRAGSEVVQVYIAAPNAGNGIVPVKQLKGFERVDLAAHEKKTVTVSLNSDDWWFIDANQKRVVDEGAYKVQIGRSCSDIVAQFDLTVSGKAAPTIQTVTLMGDKIKVTPTQPSNTSLYIAMSDETFLQPSQATVTYSSNRPGVATVDQNGKITAGGLAGTAVITASVTYAGKTLNATYAVASDGNPDTPANADSIMINNVKIPGFSPTVYNYEIALPFSQSGANVTATTPVSGAAVTVAQAASIPGTAVVTVTNGTSSTQYSLYIGRPPQPDNFAGPAHAPFWNVVRETAANYQIANNKLSITTESGDLWQNVNSQRNIFVQPAAGDWTCSVDIDFNTVPNVNYQQAGIMVYQDDDNYLKLDVEYSNGLVVQLGSEVNQVFTVVASAKLTGVNPNDIINLKVVRAGNNYTFFYSMDHGATYTQLGTAQTASMMPPQIALTASSSASSSVSIVANFSNFNVTASPMEFPVIPVITGINVDGAPLAGFSADKAHYESVMAYGRTAPPVVTAATNLPDNLTITQAASLPGTAEVKLDYNGTVLDYTIYFGFAPRPDSLSGDWIIPAWTIDNPNMNNLSIGKGALVISTEDGDVWQTTNNVRNLVWQPAAGDWTVTVTAKFQALPDTNYQQGGIMVYDDLDNFLKMDVEYNGSKRMLQLGGETDATFSAIQQIPSSGSTSFALAADNSIMYRIARLGDTYNFYYSVDNGSTFTAIGAAQTKALRAPKIALVALNNSSAANIPVAYTNFNVTMASPVPAPAFVFRAFSKEGQLFTEYNNAASAAVNGSFLVAVYDGSGRLNRVLSKNLGAPSSQLAWAAFGLDPAAYAGYSIKAFAWGDPYTPLAGAVTVQ